MRIWDISPKRLCRNHLLGEHRELHAIWSVLVNGKKGYVRHQETLRWRGKLKALFSRHDALVREMAVRGYEHQSPLPKRLARGSGTQRVLVATRHAQIEMLRKKRCRCDV
jgi:ribose 1,5-bisphosphokinase PhnN